jgi:hypothetical protein
MLFSTTKITIFLGSVIAAVSAQSGVFSSAPNCTGTQLQTVEFTDGLCTSLVAFVEVDMLTCAFLLGVPSNDAESAVFGHKGPTQIFIMAFCELEFHSRVFAEFS